jgi:hypothetical protein
VKRPRAKRLILLLLAYATGGAIINVAVAWGCVEHANRRPHNKSLICYTQLFGRVRIKSDAGRLVVGMNGNGKVESGMDFSELSIGTAEFRGMLPSGSAFVSNGSSRLMRRVDRFREVLAGWPALSLRGYRELAIDSNVDVTKGLFRLPGMDTSPGVWNEFPTLPLWPGFAMNTLFYCAMLWLLFVAPWLPGHLRRNIRARRGQCPACAYPIGVSDVCTECGAAVTQ